MIETRKTTLDEFEKHRLTEDGHITFYTVFLNEELLRERKCKECNGALTVIQIRKTKIIGDRISTVSSFLSDEWDVTCAECLITNTYDLKENVVKYTGYIERKKYDVWLNGDSSRNIPAEYVGSCEAQSWMGAQVIALEAKGWSTDDFNEQRTYYRWRSFEKSEADCDNKPLMFTASYGGAKFELEGIDAVNRFQESLGTHLAPPKKESFLSKIITKRKKNL